MPDETLKPATTYSAIVGEVLGQIRKSRNLRQDQIAEALGITQATYSRIESGQSSMTVEQLRITARRIGSDSSRVSRYAEEVADQLFKKGVKVTDTRVDAAVNKNIVMIGATELVKTIVSVLSSPQT